MYTSWHLTSCRDNYQGRAMNLDVIWMTCEKDAAAAAAAVAW